MSKIFKIGKHKKASLELSINAIIIVVLAMTLLGLGLVFIRGMFANITETTSTVQETVKEQILDDLRTGDKKLSFPTSELFVGKKASKDLAVGIKNTNPTSLQYTLKIFIITDAGDEVPIINREPVTTETGVEVGKFIWNPAIQSLDINDAVVEPVKFIAGSTPDTYIFKFKAMSINSNDGTESQYASKTFFLTIG